MDKAHRETDKELEAMEKHLAEIYTRAGKEVQEKADAYFEQFARLDAVKQKLVQQGDMTLQEYKTWRRNKFLYATRFDNLKMQMAAELTHVNQTALDYINGRLPQVYALNYNALAPQVDGLGGYSFELTDAQTVANLASKDQQLLPYREIDPARDIPWNMKHIQSELLQGILQGDSIPRLAQRMQRVTDMDRVAAVRNARTMVTGAECKGRQDSYVQAQRDGIQLQRRWISTNDGRTRHAHRLLQGAIAEVDKPFDSDLGPIMYPGDPEAAPANVYNCRCTIAAKILGFKKAAAIPAGGKAEPKPAEKKKRAPRINMKEFAQNAELYVGGGYDIDDIFTPQQLDYIKKHMTTTEQHLYRIEGSRFTADRLDEDILDVDDFAFDGTFRSFSRGTDVIDSFMQDLDFAGDDLSPTIFETVGKVKHFNMDKYAEFYVEDQQESLVGGRWEVVGEDMRQFGGQFIRVIKIRQKR